MKRIFIGTVFLISICFTYAQSPKDVGISMSIAPTWDLNELNKIHASGIKYIEVVLNQFCHNKPENQYYTLAYEAKNVIDSSDLKVWSCHLPYSRKIDISSPNQELRNKSVEFLSKSIRLSSIYKPYRLILHPSTEPIEEEQREEHIKNCIESIGQLALVAKEIGAVLCIENLPRTCLGRNSEEMLRLIKNYPEVMICFDTTHLTQQDYLDFVNNLSGRIASLHISDSDGINECHWGVGKGIIPWNKVYNALLNNGYNGVVMHEVRKDGTTYNQIYDAFNNLLINKK